MSVQYVADASQKFTWPVLIAPEAGVTVAVRMTTVPVGTEVDDPALVVTARAVVVATLLCADATTPIASHNAIATLVEEISRKGREENQEETHKIAAYADETKTYIAITYPEPRPHSSVCIKNSRCGFDGQFSIILLPETVLYIQVSEGLLFDIYATVIARDQRERIRQEAVATASESVEIAHYLLYDAFEDRRGVRIGWHHC
jgi:hypothetical protein